MAEHLIASDSLCRACIAPHFGEKVDLLLVPNLADLYAWLSSSHVTVDKNDSLPKQICAQCYHQLEAINRFRTMCTESYNTLSARLSKGVVPGPKIRYEITYSNSDENNASSCQRLKKIDCSTQRGEPNSNVTSNGEKTSNADSSKCDDLIELDDNSGSNSSDDVTMIEMQPDMEYFHGSTRPASTQKISEDGHTVIGSDDESDPEYLDADEAVGKRRLTPKFYKCNKCPRRFSVKERYIGHLRQHQGLKPFECNQCHKIYSRLERLRSHVQSDHSERPIRFLCPIVGCFKKYKNQDTFKKHIAGHSPDVPNEGSVESNPNTMELPTQSDSKEIEDNDKLLNFCSNCQSRFDKFLNNRKVQYKTRWEAECLICAEDM